MDSNVRGCAVSRGILENVCLDVGSLSSKRGLFAIPRSQAKCKSKRINPRNSTHEARTRVLHKRDSGQCSASSFVIPLNDTAYMRVLTRASSLGCCTL